MAGSTHSVKGDPSRGLTIMQSQGSSLWGALRPLIFILIFLLNIGYYTKYVIGKTPVNYANRYMSSATCSIFNQYQTQY